MTSNRPYPQFIELRKPLGVGMERWRRMKILWKDHTPASRGVIFTHKHCKLHYQQIRSLHAASGESYGQSI